MNQFRFLSLTVLLALFLCAGAVFAQTPTNVTIVSGNGQLICQGCVGNIQGGFAPLVARVTDANGLPVPGATVTWSITAGGFNGGQLSQTQTITDASGLTSNFFFPGFFSNQGGGFNNYSQTTILATAGTGSATFTLTQALQDQQNFSVAPIQVLALPTTPSGAPAQSLLLGTSITGQVGTTSSTPIVIRVITQTGQPVPNVSVNIFNFQTASTGPIVQCAAAAGAGAGTVLTDATGTAICNPVFGGVPNVPGQYEVVIGGSVSNDPNTPPQGFWFFPAPPTGLNVRVTPGTPGALVLVSGNSQSAQAGGRVAAPLVVEVDSTAGSPLAGAAVNWTVSPGGSASLSSTQTATDATGRTSNTVTFSPTANGTVQVTAALATDATKKFTFTLTAIPNITITGLTAVSGGGQTAIVNTAFGAPLVVQLNASNGTASGVPVQFSINGPGILSASVVNTDATGRASVNVTAGGTAGGVTVTASANGLSQTFNLTVAPPGPTLTAASFLNGADFQRGALSPCSIATIIAPGLAPGLQTMVVGSNIVGPLQTKLANDTVTVNGATAPLYSVGLNAGGQEQLTFQVPCDVTPGSSIPVTVNVGPGSATVNIPIQQASPGIFLTQMEDGQNHPVLIRPDGTFVSIRNPARKGEALVAFVTGVGPSSPPVGTNSLPGPGAQPAAQYTVVAGMGGVGGVPVLQTQLSPDLVGVWMVTFQIPSGVATGNVAFSIGVVPTGSNTQIPSATSTIPVQ